MAAEIAPELILDALADGLTQAQVSKRYRVPIEEVRRIMKEATERCYDGAYLREHWMLEDRRLYAMELKFRHKAMLDDGSPADAMVAVKTSERRAMLAGANHASVSRSACCLAADRNFSMTPTPSNVMLNSDLHLPKIGRGKVRDIYAVNDDRLLLITTDRISAFDVVMGETIPMRGAVLTQISAYWFNELEGVVPHHMISADKQPLRDYLDTERRAGRWNGEAPPPPLPASVQALPGSISADHGVGVEDRLNILTRLSIGAGQLWKSL